jgi:hypothetical protein
MRKEVYFLRIVDVNGKIHQQYLKRSEITLLPTILAENKSVNIESTYITKDHYKLLFNC